MTGRHARIAIGGLACCLFASPVAAHSPNQANRDLIDSLNAQLLYVAVPLTLFVLAILAYAIVRFRDNPDPEPTAEDPALEITWTIVTAIILVFVGVSAYSVLASPYLSPQSDSGGAIEMEGESPAANDDAVVEVVATQFQWHFTYPDGGVTTRNELVLPAEENVTLAMTSGDVIHSFAVQELGIKQDVFPGTETYVRTRIESEGEYLAQCFEFCGSGHAYMHANVTVVDGSAYEAWVDEHEGESNVTEVPEPDPDADAE